MCNQIRMLAEGDLKSGLRRKIVRSSQGDMLVANNLQCASLRVAIGDIVYYVRIAGMVDACVADEDGQLLVIVRRLQYQGTFTANSELWTQTQGLEIWPANALNSPRAWYFSDHDLVVVR